MNIPTKRLSTTAKIPLKQSTGAAGYDLYASFSHQIPSGEFQIVHTDIAVAIPKGQYGRIAPRSGLAAKKGIDVLAGVIDSDYRGAIGVVLMNHGTEPFEVSPGDRIAQIIIEGCADAQFGECETLPEAARGQGGFGSTGL